jgi:predicted acetyltransferase
MIKFSDKNTEPAIRQMWKDCFDDTDKFVNFYFEKKYTHENTLVYFEENKPVASLQMLPYTITFYGAEIPVSYFSGLCTLPEYRKRGYMEKLILESFQVLNERKIPLAALIPAEDWLYDYYRRFEFEKVFDSDKNIIPLPSILELYKENKQSAYTLFDNWFRNKDFCIQKNFNDFDTIMQEYICDGCPDKHNLDGMARIINANLLSGLFQRKNKELFSLKITDSQIKNNNISLNLEAEIQPHEIDIKLYTRLLFGYHTNELENYKNIFPQHQPVMNLMLE